MLTIENDVLIKCDENAILDTGVCVSLADKNCKTKSVEEGLCETCENKYSNNNGTCEEVDITNCAEYEGDQCKTCDATYHLKNNVCYSHISNCNNQDGGVCMVCADRYRNDSTKCTMITINNCAAYTGVKCKTCNQNYRYNSTPNTCTAVVGQCNNYNADGTCKVCNTGYTGATCQNCIDNYKRSGAYCVAKTCAKGVYVTGLDKCIWNAGTGYDFWQAKSICNNNGMILPDNNTLWTIYAYRSQYSCPPAGVWSSTEIDANNAHAINFGNGIQNTGAYRLKVGKKYVLCMGNYN